MKHQDLFHRPVFNQGFMFNDFAPVEQRLISAEKVYNSMKQKFEDMKSQSKDLKCHKKQ